MAAITIYPLRAPSLGRTKVTVCVDIADQAAPKLATELDASTSIDLSCALRADGWGPSVTQGKTEAQRRLCDVSSVEILQPAQFQISTVLYSVGDPQEADEDIEGLLVEGAILHITERLGPLSKDPWVVGQKSIDHYVQLGPPYWLRDLGADNGEFHRGVEVAYLGAGPVEGVVAA